MESTEEGDKLRFPEVDINWVNRYDRSALLAAAVYGNDDIVKILLDFLPDEYNTLKQRTMGIRMLDLEIEDDCDRSVLHLLAQNIKEDKNNGNDFMNIAKDIHNITDIKYPGRNVFSYLCSQKDIDGNTPLHIACERGQTQLALYLLTHGKQHETKNESDRTPIMMAAVNNHYELIINLCGDKDLDDQDSININDVDMDNQTALHIAAENGHIQSVQALLRFDVHIEALNQRKETPLALAAKNRPGSECPLALQCPPKILRIRESAPLDLQKYRTSIIFLPSFRLCSYFEAKFSAAPLFRGKIFGSHFECPPP